MSFRRQEENPADKSDKTSDSNKQQHVRVCRCKAELVNHVGRTLPSSQTLINEVTIY